MGAGHGHRMHYHGHSVIHRAPAHLKLLTLVGFIDRADDSSAAKSPLADYSTKGVDNDRISGGIAGVAGSALVLVLAGGLFWVLRRRDPAPSRDSG